MPPYERDVLATSYERQFQRALQRVLDFEVDAIKKALGLRSYSFENIYTSEIPKKLKKFMGPLEWGYYEAIFAATEHEVGLSLVEHKGQLDDFTKKYIEVFQLRYCSSHGAQLEALVNVDEVVERLEQWLATGAARRARDEIVRQGQSTFRETVGSVGMSVIWHTRSKPCAFCARLNGVKVSGETPFVDKMTDLTEQDADGKPITMKVYHKTLSPHLHRSCSCFLSSQ